MNCTQECWSDCEETVSRNSTKKEIYSAGSDRGKSYVFWGQAISSWGTSHLYQFPRVCLGGKLIKLDCDDGI